MAVGSAIGGKITDILLFGWRHAKRVCRHECNSKGRQGKQDGNPGTERKQALPQGV